MFALNVSISWAGSFILPWGCIFNCNCIAGLSSVVLWGEWDCGRMNNGATFGLKVLFLLSFQFLKRVFLFYLLSHVFIRFIA